MAEGQYASKGYFEVNGVPVIRSTGLNLTQDTNSDDVDTILDEGGGYSQGTVKYKLDIENPVPADGFEIKWFEVAAAGKIHVINVVVLNPNGGIAYQKLLRGVFRDPKLGIKANSAATNGVMFHGREVVRAAA